MANQLFSVEAEDAGRRLDLFLSRKLERTSRSAVRRWIESGQVKVNGRQVKASHPVRSGDQVEVVPAPPEPTDLLPEPIPLSIVYEDEVLVVVDKPAGMVVHPGAGNRRGTLANALLHHFQQISRRQTVRPGMIHRLDKGTSGLLVVAKGESVHDFLAAQFKERQVEKHYLALLYGWLEKRRGVIDLPVGRDPRVRTRISARSPRGRPALTEYEVIRFLPAAEGSRQPERRIPQEGRDFSYVRAILHTGRTHQIRVHFQHIGHPVVGDPTYGGGTLRGPGRLEMVPALRSLERPFLHATFLSFVHPSSRRRVSFESPLPPELAALLSILE